MSKSAAMLLQGDVLNVHPYEAGGSHATDRGRAFVLEVADDAVSRTLTASLPLLDRLLSEKVAAARERWLEEMVDFMAARMLAPSEADVAMAQRLADRHARILNEFGYFTAEQLADLNGSSATNRSALADNWRKRRQVFSVPHPDRSARGADIYPAFQFDSGKPLKVVQAVLDVFGTGKSPWKLALWFTSNNGWLPDSARPVDLLSRDPQAVIAAAQRDAAESAA